MPASWFAKVAHRPVMGSHRCNSKVRTRGWAPACCIPQANGAREQTERMTASRHEQVLRVLDAARFPQAVDRALCGLEVAATRYAP